jgi:hyperosmotically inducible protein
VQSVKFPLLKASFLCCCLVVSLAACSSTPQQESTGEFFDSSMITARVKASLIDDGVTRGYRIRVSTYKGVVHLKGYVNSDQEKYRAATIARGIEGVKGIENALVVRADDIEQSTSANY